MNCATLLLIALLVSCAIIGGCIQTPAKVANGMPAVLKNVSNDVGNVTGPIGDRLSNISHIKSVNVSIEFTGDS
jgi:hypothetical protein